MKTNIDVLKFRIPNFKRRAAPHGVIIASAVAVLEEPVKMGVEEPEHEIFNIVGIISEKDLPTVPVFVRSVDTE